MARQSYSRTFPIGVTVGLAPQLLLNTNPIREDFTIQNSSSSPIKFGFCGPQDTTKIVHTLYPNQIFTQRCEFTYLGPISVMGTTAGQLVTGDYGTA